MLAMRMTSAVATVHYQHVPAEVFRDLPFPGADLAANMFQFVAEDNGYGDRRDVALARSLNPSLLSFSEWVAATADMPPLARPVTAGTPLQGAQQEREGPAETIWTLTNAEIPSRCLHVVAEL